VNDLAEAFDDPQIRHRAMIVEHEVPGSGAWQHIGNPIKVGAQDPDLVRLPPPRLGEHTEEVLTAAGIGPDELEALRADGAI
jgi:crotonobetainyl-CoA:carnitine CoA-transferase CaiB-like acyl-CoA transferase